MKIVIKNDEHKNIVVILPTGLFANKLTAAFVCRALKKKGINIPLGCMSHFLKALNKYRHKHKDWILAEINGSDGDYVKIKI